MVGFDKEIIMQTNLWNSSIRRQDENVTVSNNNGYKNIDEKSWMRHKLAMVVLLIVDVAGDVHLFSRPSPGYL